MRYYKTKSTYAHIQAIPETKTTRIIVSQVASGWRAGQHCRIRIISSQLGWLGWAVSHPFTIASASDDGGLVLLCKSSGEWTGKLYNLACQSEKRYTSVSIWIEGPYGTQWPEKMVIMIDLASF